MTTTPHEGHAPGSTALLILLSASLVSCTGTTAPDAPATPGLSAELARPSSSSTFSFRRSIAIDSGASPATDLKDFPVLISGTFDGTGHGEDRTADLRTAANGGKLRSTSGYDVGFYTDKDCFTGKMSWETEQYDGVTGQAAYWVRVPTVYHDARTVFYLCYGNAAITTDQSSAASVWDAGFLAVWHLADHGGLVLSNSKSASFPLTNPGPVAAAPGKIGGGTNKFIDNTYWLGNDDVSIGADGALTVSMWKKLLATDNTDNADGSENHISFAIGPVHSVITLWAPFFGTAFWYYGSGGPDVDFSGYYDRWVYITAVYDPAASRLKALYLDGNLATSSTDGATTEEAQTGFRIGQAVDGHGQDPSQFDEVRISTAARSADWIKTEFANQNDPASFYLIGPEKRLK